MTRVLQGTGPTFKIYLWVELYQNSYEGYKPRLQYIPKGTGLLEQLYRVVVPPSTYT